MLTIRPAAADYVALELPTFTGWIKVGFAVAIGFWLASALVWALYMYAFASFARAYLLGLT